MKIRTMAITAVLATTALAAPAGASASSYDWYWSTQRAELALKTYDRDARSGVACSGASSLWRTNGQRLYRKFSCDEYAPGGYVGSGVIKVTGHALNRYRWVAWQSA
jgi:hypothetical protein